MIEKYKQIAQHVASETFNKLGLKRAPVDIEGIIRDLGIIYMESPNLEDSVSGFTKRTNKDGKPIIVVNKNHREHRRRFTAAHELGHHLLHTMADVFIDTDKEKILYRKKNNIPQIDIREIQANNFAAEILMPRSLLLKDLGESISTDPDSLDQRIEELAQAYNVSTQAMTIRIGSFLC